MRHESHPITLPQVLERAWRSLRHETSISEYVFAAEVRNHYERLVPASARSIEWSQHPDITTRMRRDAEKLSRWFDDDVRARFPAEAIEAFIAAFPLARCSTLQQELAKRQGLLVWRMPEAGAGADCDNLGRAGKETGEAMIAVAAMLDDNAINKLDRDKAENAITQINEALAVWVEVRTRIERQALNDKENTGGE